MKVSQGKRFTWRIENFSRLKTKKLYSEIFYVGGRKWRLLIFPQGDNVDHLSLYLDVDKETLQYGRSRFIKFSLYVINQITNKLTVKKDTKLQFNAQNSYWGFTSFMPLSELRDPGRGYLVNDTCVVEADFAGAIVECLVCDPKKVTGHVELRVGAGRKREMLTVEAAKTASGKGETPKSSSQEDINRRIRQTASGTDTILPRTDTLGPPPSSKSAVEVVKTSVPPTTPIVGKESTVNSPQAQYPVGSFSPVSNNKVKKRKKDDPSPRFTWKIENFSKLNSKKLYSQIFYAKGHQWRVLIFPQGNNVNHLSVYLDVVDKEMLSRGWRRWTKFSLSVVNHIDNKFTVTKETQHEFKAHEIDWGFTSFMPLSELNDPGSGYLVNDTCVVEADFTGSVVDRSGNGLEKETGLVELQVKAGASKKKKLGVEAAKTASGKGGTRKSSSQGDINGRIFTYQKKKKNGRIRLTASILPQTDTLGPPPVSKSASQVIKTSVPPTTPIVGTESMVNCPQAQDLEVELPWSLPMGSPLESSSFDDMDAYISKLVSVVETDAPFDSTTEGSVVASIPQSTIDEAKKFFIKMLSQDPSEIPDFAARLTESICVLSECCDLTPAQLAQLNTLKIEFPTLLKTYQTSNHSLKEVEGKMAEKQGTKKSLVEQVKNNALAFQMQRAIHKDLISKEAGLQHELAKISEKKKSAEKEIKQLHGKMVNLEQSRSSVLKEISTLETEKKTAESSLSWVQQKWSELRHIFMEPNK